MPLDAQGTKKLKQQIGIARQKPLKFGLALGKKAADTALIMHREKDAGMLRTQARNAPGAEAAKSCQGTVTVDGKSIVFACETDPPTGMKTKCRAFFKDNKLEFTIKILTPSGEEFEADEGAKGDPVAEAVTKADPLQAKWEAAAGQMPGKLAAVLKAGKGDLKKMRAVWALAKTKAEAEDYAAAMQAVAALVKLMAGAAVEQADNGAAPGSDDEQPKTADPGSLRERLRALREKIQSLPDNGKEKFLSIFKATVAQLQKGDLVAASLGADKIEAALKNLTPKDMPQKGVVAKRKFLITRWQQIPKDLSKEVSTLKSSIERLVPYENADEIAAMVTARLNAKTNELKSVVDNALLEDINSGDPKYGATAAALESMRRDIQEDELIAELRSTTLCDGTRFERAYLSCLSEVQGELTR